MVLVIFLYFVSTILSIPLCNMVASCCAVDLSSLTLLSLYESLYGMDYF